MPFKDEKFYGPAEGGDAGGVAIAASIALSSVADALEGIQAGQDIEKHLNMIRDQAERLHKLFDEMTGYYEG